MQMVIKDSQGNRLSDEQFLLVNLSLFLDKFSEMESHLKDGTAKKEDSKSRSQKFWERFEEVDCIVTDLRQKAREYREKTCNL